MATTKRNISTGTELKTAMEALEKKVRFQEVDIKENFLLLKQDLQPKEVVKNTFSYLAETPEIQRTLVNTVFGFILGYASKKAVQMLSEQSLDKTVENFVTHQMNQLESKGTLLSQVVTLVRKFTPPDSPIYPFVRYN